MAFVSILEIKLLEKLHPLVLVILIIAMKKYVSKSSLRTKGFVLAHSMRIQFLRVVRDVKPITALAVMARMLYYTWGQESERTECWCFTLL